MTTPRALLVLAPLALALACQRIEEPTPTPTTDQWRRVQENLLDAPPDLQHPIGAVFADAIRLHGWDVEPDAVEVGGELRIRLYWEALKPLDERWFIFVHLDSNTRQNVDHEAIGNVYPTIYWEPGKVVRDEVTVTLSNDVTSDEVRVLVGFFRDDVRMPVTDPGAGTLDADGRLDVGAFSARWSAPEYVVRRAQSPIEIDGRPTDRAWSRAGRTSAWVHPNTGADLGDLNTWAKILWDDDAIYVLMNARDSDVWATITDRDGDLWTEEVLEFYLDPSGEGRGYLELQINPLGTIFDAVFEDFRDRDLPSARAIDLAGLESAVYVSGTTDDRSDRDRSWTAELRIPLSSVPGLTLPITEQTTALANFYRYDRPEGGEVATAAWSPVGGGSFHNPPRFGVLSFEMPAADEGSAEGSGAQLRPAPIEPLRRRP